MNKFYSLFILLFLLVSNNIQAQENTYNMVIEMTNGTKISIGPNDVKNVTFNDGQLTVTGEDLQSWLINIAASVEANDTKISTLQKEVYSWQSYIDSWTTSMEGMQANMVNANNQIVALNTSTVSNSTSINNLKTLIEQLSARVTALEKGGTGPEQPTATINVTTYDASDVAENSASLNGSVSASNTTKNYTAGFFLATSGTPSSSNYTKNVEAGSNKTANYTASVTGLSDNTAYRFRAYVLYDGEYYYGETKIFTTAKATTGTLNGHEWVDLGLPSGTKWATCNIGASSPTGYGNYYAWGETEIKNIYKLNTYRYYANGIWINIGNDISGSQYDVAYAKWGGTWRMPTREQEYELLEKCTYTWVMVSGIGGYKFVGPNGNSIFLPAASYYYDGGQNPQSIQDGTGMYWSSTAYEPEYAYAISFNNNSQKYTNQMSIGKYCNRDCGAPVRPVTK